jgi:hypothetical protein
MSRIRPDSGLTQKRLRHLFIYDHCSGVFTRLVTVSNQLAGTVAGNPDSKGHIQISVDGRRYLAHRLVWLYIYGHFPRTEIDHINRLRNDNSLSNLRLVTHAQNCQNAGLRKDNTSGIKGVSWNKIRKKWHASICDNKKTIHLGYFDCVNAAADIVAQKRNELHGAFGCSSHE